VAECGPVLGGWGGVNLKQTNFAEQDLAGNGSLTGRGNECGGADGLMRITTTNLRQIHGRCGGGGDGGGAVRLRAPEGDEAK
jgi:hypothetical protein